MKRDSVSFYVYALFHPLDHDFAFPRYIGKGHGVRAFWSRTAAPRPFASGLRKLRGQRSRFSSPLAANLFEDEALSLEVDLIKLCGRQCDGGPLLNISAGGTGVSNPPPSVREKIGAAQHGRKKSPDEIAKLSAANRGRKHTADARAKISAAQRGRKRSTHAIAKTAAANRGRKQSPEHTAASAAAQRGRKQSPDAIAKTAAANRGRKLKPFSAEHRARIAAARRGKPPSPEHRAAIGDAHRGRKHSAEHVANQAAARRARVLTWTLPSPHLPCGRRHDKARCNRLRSSRSQRRRGRQIYWRRPDLI